MDGVGRGAGLCVVHGEAGEEEPEGDGRRRARGRQEEGEEEEQQGWRHSAPKSTCKGKVGSPNISFVEYTPWRRIKMYVCVPSIFCREKDLQQQMKKIINQGEKIRRHLVNLKAEVGATGQRGDEDGNPQNLVDPVDEPILQGKVSSTYAVDPVLAANSEEGTDSGNVTEGSETGEVDKEGVLEEEKAGGDTKEANETALKSEAKTVVSSTEEGTDVDENDVRDLIEMLEKLHRINKVLESKEEQILTMKFECEALTEGTETLEAPNPTFNREVGEYRRVNAALLRNIADNSTMLRGLKEESEERKKEVARLEFDVNLIERESKRLESDLVKVKSIGCRANIGQISPREMQSKSGIMLRDGPARGRNVVEGSPTKIYGTRSEVQAGMYNNSNNNTSDSLSGHQAAKTVAQPSKRLPQMDQQQARPSHNPANTDPHSPKTAPDMALPLLQGPAISPSSPIHSTCDPLVDPTPNPSADDRASPPGSSRGSDKSVRFNDRENVLRFCSTASSASLSPPPLLLPVLSPRSILKCVKGGYGSDSGSDTGVSSLSSMQGDYELSTLV